MIQVRNDSVLDHSRSREGEKACRIWVCLEKRDSKTCWWKENEVRKIFKNENNPRQP